MTIPVAQGSRRRANVAQHKADGRMFGVCQPLEGVGLEPVPPPPAPAPAPEEPKRKKLTVKNKPKG